MISVLYIKLKTIFLIEIVYTIYQYKKVEQLESCEQKVETVIMSNKCCQCNLLYKQSQLQKLQCERHFVCKTCFAKTQIKYCEICEVGISQILTENQAVHKYPIQGIMVYYDKVHNPGGLNQFSSRMNCHGKTAAWTMISLLATVFFFSGLAMAIKTNEVGTGVIISIIGAVGLFFALFFICKIRKVDKRYQNHEYTNQDYFIYLKQERGVISSVASSNNDT